MDTKYVVLDTNIWLDFLREDEGEKLLAIVEDMILESKISIVVPAPILTEWENRYRQYLTYTPDGALLQNSRNVVDALSENINQSKKLIAAKVDKLLKSGTLLQISNEVKINAVDRMHLKIAPFHSKTDSINDCLLYFSVITWCKENTIAGFHFVTRNTKDFSDIQTKENLHPSLIIDDVDVQYFINFRNFLFTIDSDCFNRVSVEGDEEAIILPQLFTGKRVIDEWDNALEYYHKHIHCIPRSIVSRLYPMCNSNKMPIGYSHRSVYINNDDMISFLQGIQSVDFNKEFDSTDNTISVEDFTKIKSVFQSLNGSLILELRVHRPEFKFDCSVEPCKSCICVRCQYKRLALSRSLIRLTNEPSDEIEENLRHGYVRFLLRDYLLSLKFFYKVYQQAAKEKLHIIQLIMAQNIKKLKKWIKDFYKDDIWIQQFKIIETLDSDLIYAANMHLDLFTRECSKLVYRNGFIEIAKSGIINLHSEISKHYEIQLGGGHSSNNNLRDLVFRFTELKNFYELNSVIVDRDNEALSDIYSYVLEAYLMCYQFNETQSSRMDSFNDYFVIEIAFYSKPEVLREYVRKYKVTKIKYLASEDGVNETLLVTVGLLTEVKKFCSYKSEESDLHNWSSLPRHYFNYLSNLLFLCSFLEFSDSDVSQLAERLVEAIEVADLSSAFYKNVFGGLLFISEKYKFFSDDMIVRIIKAVTITDDWERRKWVQELGELLINKETTVLKDNLVLSSQVYNLITCIKTHESLESKMDYLIHWFELMHPQHMALIKENIRKELKEKFRPNLYYHTSIYGLCDYTEFYEQYLQTVGIPENEEDESYYARFPISSRLNELLNLAFKYNIPLSEPEFKQFKNRQFYFDWLLDMDAFDYSNFNLEWISKYQTYAYMKKIFSNKKCIAAIQKELAKSPNETISGLYFKYAFSED